MLTGDPGIVALNEIIALESGLSWVAAWIPLPVVSKCRSADAVFLFFPSSSFGVGAQLLIINIYLSSAEGRCPCTEVEVGSMGLLGFRRTCQINLNKQTSPGSEKRRRRDSRLRDRGCR